MTTTQKQITSVITIFAMTCVLVITMEYLTNLSNAINSPLIKWIVFAIEMALLIGSVIASLKILRWSDMLVIKSKGV